MTQFNYILYYSKLSCCLTFKFFLHSCFILNYLQHKIQISHSILQITYSQTIFPSKSMGRRSQQYSQNRYLLFSFAKMSNWHSQNAQFYSHSQKNVGIRKKCPIRIRQMHDFILICKKMLPFEKMSNSHSQNAQFYSHSQRNVWHWKKCPIGICKM